MKNIDEIKVIDRKNGYQYGENQIIFDISKDYKNEYAKVYFRIDTPSYIKNDDNEYKEFKKEANMIIEKLGFNIAKTCGCDEGRKEDGQYLYLHPQEFSGIVLKNDIRIILNTLLYANTFNITWVDVYETIYVMSDEEYENKLSEKYDNVKKDLLEKFVTKRTNKFHSTSEIIRVISEKYKIKRLNVKDEYGCGQTGQYIRKIYDELVNNGYLIEVENSHGKLSRTINKTEQKKLKLFIA